MRRFTRKSNNKLFLTFTLSPEKAQIYILLLWFLFSNVLQLICWLSFLPTQPRSAGKVHIADYLMVTMCHTTMILFFCCMICVHFFCIEPDHSSSFWDAQCHFASHACLLVASCCLPEPPNALLCSFVDMAPSAVGHCPFCISAEVRFIITLQMNSTNSQASA